MEGVLSLLLLGGLRGLIKVSQRYPGDIDWEKTGVVTHKRALIIGAGNSGINIARELKSNPHLGLKPVVFLDDDPKKIGMKTQGLHIFGPVIKLADIVKEQNIDEVIIAMPSAPEQTIRNIQYICQDISIGCTTLPSLSTFMENNEESGRFAVFIAQTSHVVARYYCRRNTGCCQGHAVEEPQYWLTNP